jgi:release factor glutamine methyltransferase
LTITPDCLIPRPETEHLVEIGISFLRQRQSGQHVLDLCTGSGCIAAAIAKNVNDANIVATDISDAALKCGDLFDPVIEGLDDGRFDLIVSNPPYVSEAEYEALDKNVKEHEPSHALLAGADGLDVYKRIAEKVDDFLKPDGALMMEIGYAQGPAIRELLEKTGVFKTISIEKDFANNDRITVAIK